jgi:type 1 fimbriae regulatory protein FimE
MNAARKTGRHGHRDATLILLMYRHGFRVSELVSLRWEQIELKQGLLHVNRVKNGSPSSHPIRGPEIRALRRLKRDYPDTPMYLSPSEKAR